MNTQSDSSARTNIEAALTDIFSRIFDKADISPEDDFFALGGTSLTAIKLIEQVEKLYGEDALDPDFLFENGRLSLLAKEIDQTITRK